MVNIANVFPILSSPGFVVARGVIVMFEEASVDRFVLRTHLETLMNRQRTESFWYIRTGQRIDRTNRRVSAPISLPSGSNLTETPA